MNKHLQDFVDEFLKMDRKDQEKLVRMLNVALEGEQEIVPPPTGNPPGGPPKP